MNVCFLEDRRMGSYTKEDLRRLQNLPLEQKIMITQTRIIEFYLRMAGNVFVSYSGGKDSTVLLDLARRCYPDIVAAYVNTGLDYPEVRKMAMGAENVTVLKPEMRFPEVIKKYGWCFPSKEMAKIIYHARKGSTWAINRLNGMNKEGQPDEWKQNNYAKWAFLVDSPFIISHRCCEEMKEKPFSKYYRRTGKMPIIGTLAEESTRRRQAWIGKGCNIYNGYISICKPLSFWTEQDILEYIKITGLPIASVYGEIKVNNKGKLETTGCKRTGCVFCPTGCHLEKPENRFQRLSKTHPKLHKYCMDTLKLGEFLDYIGVVKE